MGQAAVFTTLSTAVSRAGSNVGSHGLLQTTMCKVYLRMDGQPPISDGTSATCSFATTSHMLPYVASRPYLAASISRADASAIQGLLGPTVQAVSVSSVTLCRSESSQASRAHAVPIPMQAYSMATPASCLDSN